VGANQHATRSVINQNFFIGVIFIIGGMTLATFGYLNPIVAALLHNAGSLLVVFNSARLVRQGEGLEAHAPVVEQKKEEAVSPQLQPQLT
jgi:Zn2+/Cd2+-exporting ATPase